MDLLRWPVVRALARRPRTQVALRLSLLVLAAALVLHGLFGPQIAPRNMATVFSWVHYRGLLIVALLAVGNLFCTACPMILVRDAGRRVVHPARRWPRLLRNKWPALVLFVGVLFTYELFDLWSLPRATALLILGYFAAALVIDVVFAGATFCKYLCPIGQFNFVASTVSPTELRIRDAGTCGSCRTVDCIKGRRPAAAEPAPAPAAAVAIVLRQPRAVTAAPAPVLQRGCELGLFLPGKVGNLDCTLCLDCVRACPHDNIGLVTRVPAEELSEPARRSGIGRLSSRPDLAALVVVFTFGALLNAFAMTAPAVRVEQTISAAAGVTHEALPLGVLFLSGLVLLPAALLALASTATYRLAPGARATSSRAIAMAYVYALVPLGVGIWAAHYGFHALTGVLTVIPVTQSALLDLTAQPVLGEPLWMLTGVSPGAVFPIQLGCLLLGTVGSLAVAHRISSRLRPARAFAASAPWAILILLIACAALWVLGQPMDMRGMGMAG